MKNHSRVLSWQSLENIDLLKMASEASQKKFEKNVFLTTKYEQIVKLELVHGRVLLNDILLEEQVL